MQETLRGGLAKSSTLHGARQWVHLVGKIVRIDVDGNDDAYHGYLLAATARHTILIVVDNVEEPREKRKYSAVVLQTCHVKAVEKIDFEGGK